jgi:ribonuclease HII
VEDWEKLPLIGLMKLYQYEQELFQKGYKFIAGCDEVGRGPLAGPVVAAAVILDPDRTIPGLNDSKQLSMKKRLELDKLIKKYAIDYAIAYIWPKEIDRINIYQASKKAMIKAIEKLVVKPEFILSDAMKLQNQTIPYQAIIKGDTLSASIAAASIIAKVSRDDYMIKIAEEYPDYGFEKHKGYPTKLHLEALKRKGVSPIHRKTYTPVRKVLQKQIEFDL